MTHPVETDPRVFAVAAIIDGIERALEAGTVKQRGDLLYEEETYGPACYVCHGRITRDGLGWVHSRTPRREHDIVPRDVMLTGRFRPVCAECGWEGEWTTSLDYASERHDAHLCEPGGKF